MRSQQKTKDVFRRVLSLGSLWRFGQWGWVPFQLQSLIPQFAGGIKKKLVLASSANPTKLSLPPCFANLPANQNSERVRLISSRSWESHAPLSATHRSIWGEVNYSHSWEAWLQKEKFVSVINYMFLDSIWQRVRFLRFKIVNTLWYLRMLWLKKESKKKRKIKSSIQPVFFYFFFKIN